MAKIDTSKIEGYDKMTPEQKIAALEAFDHPDPDYTGYVKKETFDATSSELAALKKKTREQLSEEETRECRKAGSDGNRAGVSPQGQNRVRVQGEVLGAGLLRRAGGGDRCGSG